MGYHAGNSLVELQNEQEVSDSYPISYFFSRTNVKSASVTRFVVLILFLLSSVYSHSQKLNHHKYPSTDPFVNDFCFSKGGSILAYTDGMNVRLCNSHSMKPINELAGGHTDRILTIDISADSTLIATGGRDGLILIWNLQTATVIKRLDFNTSMVTALRFDPAGTGIVSGSKDGRLVYYDLSAERIRFEKSVHSKIITAVAVSPCGEIIASVGADKVMYISETATGNIIFSTSDHRNWIRDVEFSPDGSRIVTCGDDRSIIVYNTVNVLDIKRLPSITKESGRINSVDLNNDNMSLVYGFDNGMLMVRTVYAGYMVKTGKPITEVRFIPGREANVVLVAATYGAGLLRIPLSGMRLTNKK